MSESEEHELGPLDSDVEADEEMGLSSRPERRMYRNRRRHGLDSRIAGTASMSRDEARLADKHVIRKLLLNAALISLWYFFSLSISIVSGIR